MNLGETILRLRTEQNMSQEDLAAALEVSRQSVSKWETNASVPELDKLVKLSALFGVTLDELVKGEKKEPPPPEPPAFGPPAGPPPERKPQVVSTAQRITGWILVCFAVAAWLLLLALDNPLLGLIAAVPFLTCGVICLTARRNAGLWCAWTLLACLDLFLRFTSSVDWSMSLLPYAYMAGMYAQLACAWGEALFIAALIVITVMRFRKRPVEWTPKKRGLFIAGAIALVLLFRVPHTLLVFLSSQHAAYQILAFVLSWLQLVLLTTLLTALAQGVLRK